MKSLGVCLGIGVAVAHILVEGVVVALVVWACSDQSPPMPVVTAPSSASSSPASSSPNPEEVEETAEGHLVSGIRGQILGRGGSTLGAVAENTTYGVRNVLFACYAGEELGDQELLDWVVKELDPSEKTRLVLPLPACAAQCDLVTKRKTPREPPFYRVDELVDSWEDFGVSGTCAPPPPPPTTTTVPPPTTTTVPPPPECRPPPEQSFELNRPLGNRRAECRFFGEDFVPGSPGDFFVTKCGKFYEVTHEPFVGATCSNGKDVSHSTSCVCK